jgi:hypothetical protein
MRRSVRAGRWGQCIVLADVHERAYVHVIMNTPSSVNAHTLSDAALAGAFASKFRELLERVAWLRRDQVRTGTNARDHGRALQTLLSLPSGDKVELCVECRRELRPGEFRRWVEQRQVTVRRKTTVVRVLALPWVSPRIADLCEEHSWSWFDLAGNYRLDVPGLLRLERTGNKPVHTRPRPTANLSTPEAARVVRALLRTDRAGMRWTQREIQKQCQPAVSLGLVNKVVRHLRDEALVDVGEDGGIRLREPLKLLYAWRDAYRFNRHERRGYFTLLQGKALHDALAKLGAQAGDLAAYAAFSAAEIQAPHVRQPRTWLYVREPTIPLLEELLEAKPVDSGENLVVLIPHDDGVFYKLDVGTSESVRLRCTNVVQTYVDVYHCKVRGEEAAEALLNQRLKPEWKQQRLNV